MAAACVVIHAYCDIDGDRLAQKTSEMAAKSSSGEAIHIGGIPIKFPCKPYGTQLSMMAKIIKGIDRRQNCLLESPTGSGKSLALLCSSLGWQSHEHRKQVIAQQEEENASNACGTEDPCEDCTCGAENRHSVIDLTDDSPPRPGPDKSDTIQQTTPAPIQGVDETDDAADFQPPKMNLRTPKGANQKPPKKTMGVMFDDDGEEKEPTTSATTPARRPAVGGCTCACHREENKCKETTNEEEEKVRIPKIYFGTRTHKQIAQIIRELKKTVYADAKMGILGSREHLCVHPEVSRSKNKNDGCRELLDAKNGISCGFHNNVQKMKFHWQLTGLGLESAWDVEDLVKLGKKVKACSYFASRSLAKDADIVFCPYNYLIDPIIRSSMEISLKGHIVILDEAHNIEDSAREAASVTVMADELQDTIDELDKLINYRWREEHCRVIHTVVAQLQRWISSHTHSLSQNDFSKASRVWTGIEMVAAFNTMGVSPATFDTLKHHLAALFEEANPQIPVEQMVALTSPSGLLIKGIFVIIDYFFRENMVYMKDYNVVLIKEISRRKWQENTNNRWFNPRRGSKERFTYSLNFWCMNPAVAFSDVGGEARSIILTSGTLSPMGSFASELGIQFAISLEANHVIKDSQVWVGSIATGPTGKTLNASYRNTETFNFQDDLGKLVLDVCRTVPYGVLCFLSSYSLMLKLSERWKNTGLWEELENLKVVMAEARGGQKREFDEQLKEFYYTIEDFERQDITSQSQTGVLFFAVCRGKVSEGMDFADNNARAVITVGIPFPSFKDPQVELKRAYNDQNRERGLLSGSEWYEIQAYRALNQALGRCLRHKNDWGALILVDERFRRNPQKYINGLSKWVRSKVNHFLHSADGMESLRNFVTRQQNAVLDNEKTTSPESRRSLDMALTPSVKNEGPGTPSTSIFATPVSRPTAVMHGFPGISTTPRVPPGNRFVHQQNASPASGRGTLAGAASSSPQTVILVKEENSDSSSPQSLVGTQPGTAVRGASLISTPLTPGGSFVPYNPVGPDPAAIVENQHHGERMVTAAETHRNTFGPQGGGVTNSEPDSGKPTVPLSDSSLPSNPKPPLLPRSNRTEPPSLNSPIHSSSKKVSPSSSGRGKTLRQPGLGQFGFHSTQSKVNKVAFVNCSDKDHNDNTLETRSDGAALKVERPGNVEEANAAPATGSSAVTSNSGNHEQGVIALGESRNGVVDTGADTPPPGTRTPSPLFCIEESDDDGDVESSILRTGCFDTISHDDPSDLKVDAVRDGEREPQTGQDRKSELTFESEVIEVKGDTETIDAEEDKLNDSVKDQCRENSGLTCIDQEQTDKEINTPSKRTPKRSKAKTRLSRSSKRSREIESNREGEGVVGACEGETPLVRRSKRSRRGTHRGEMRTSESKEVSNMDFPQVSCVCCEAKLCESGMSQVPLSEVQSCYLADKVAELMGKWTSPRKRNPLKSLDQNGVLLRIDPGSSSNIEVKQARKRGTDDQNAHWSEQDQCCYQQVVCSSCYHSSNGTTTVIGHKVVCTSDRPIKKGLTEGQRADPRAFGADANATLIAQVVFTSDVHKVNGTLYPMADPYLAHFASLPKSGYFRLV